MAMGIGIGTGTGGSGWVTTAVEKATSEFLIGPDWTMNIEICDSLNSHHLQVKDVIKCVKKRLQHKNGHVQILALTLLETMMKNCGDYVHVQVAESLLNELVKIVRKKTDMIVRDKILSLLLSWQEAFGGAGGKHPRFYWAYDELRRSGVQFPQRSPDASPIFTPPISRTSRQAQIGHSMASNSSRRLDEAMAADNEGLSMGSLDSIREAMELLNEMLQAVEPGDPEAVKDEIIADLVDCCRSNQKKLIQMLTTTGDEDLLGKGLELNDNLQTLLARHDAIASGSFVSAIEKASELKMDSKVPDSDVHVSPAQNCEDGEEDEFTQLARRHCKVPEETETTKVKESDESSPTCNALAVVEVDPAPAPAPARTKQQDMIDLLSLTVSTVPASSPASSPAMNDQTTTEVPYVASWAQAKPQQEEYPRAYPAPPWAPTPGYYTGQINQSPIGGSTVAIQHNYSFPAREGGGGGNRNQGGSNGAQKGFIPPYRLFEDLNVLGGSSGSSGQGMVGGRK